MGLIGNFKVTTMNESIEEMKLDCIAVRVPDHSLLQWDILREGISVEVEEEKPPEARKEFVVPEDYLQNENETIGSWRVN